jgi:DivIVA domain-containing protein
MPLTPAEVHNVAFKKPPIGKRGYDEEEVDAFLDIVEVELARLMEENNDLRARIGSGAGPAPAGSANGADPAELSAAREENGRLQSRVSELEKTINQGKNGAQQQVVALQQQLAQTEQQLTESRTQLEQAKQAAAAAQAAGPSLTKGGDGGTQLSSEDHHAQAVQMLALAQRTADEHLAQSKAEAERLLSEAQATASAHVSEAQASASASLADAQNRSTSQLADAEARSKKLDEDSAARSAQVVRDAEQRAATITAQFEQRKAALERRVEELRTFEREYRTRLKSYLESQLRDLDASGKADSAAAAPSDLAEAQQG